MTKAGALASALRGNSITAGNEFPFSAEGHLLFDGVVETYKTHGGY